MEIKVKKGYITYIDIHGNIKDEEDYKDIKQILYSLDRQDFIIINIINSVSIISDVVILFEKMSKKYNITFNIKNKELFSLFKRLKIQNTYRSNHEI